MDSPAPSSGRPYAVAIAAWLVAAVALTASGRLAALQPPGPQVIIAGLTAALLLGGALLPGFRRWRAGINLRQMVALHLTRFVGIWFLILYGRGELPFAFAVPAGWGDTAVATGALILVLLVPNLFAHRRWLLAWNLLGFVDLLFVVAAAARMAIAEPASMHALLVFPLGLVPVFLVPMLIATHIWLFGRLRGDPD